MFDNMTNEAQQEMINKWIKAKGNDHRVYSHGERPPGMVAPTISTWGRKRISAAERQAALDCGEE